MSNDDLIDVSIGERLLHAGGQSRDGASNHRYIFELSAIPELDRYDLVSHPGLALAEKNRCPPIT